MFVTTPPTVVVVVVWLNVSLWTQRKGICFSFFLLLAIFFPCMSMTPAHMGGRHISVVLWCYNLCCLYSAGFVASIRTPSNKQLPGENAASTTKKKFDLQASLNRPKPSYKTYTGTYITYTGTYTQLQDIHRYVCHIHRYVHTPTYKTYTDTYTQLQDIHRYIHPATRHTQIHTPSYKNIHRYIHPATRHTQVHTYILHKPSYKHCQFAMHFTVWMFFQENWARRLSKDSKLVLFHIHDNVFSLIVCMYVCMYVCMIVYMYVRMYVVHLQFPPKFLYNKLLLLVNTRGDINFMY